MGGYSQGFTQALKGKGFPYYGNIGANKDGFHLFGKTVIPFSATTGADKKQSQKPSSGHNLKPGNDKPTNNQREPNPNKPGQPRPPGSIEADYTGLYFKDPKEAALYVLRRGSFGNTEVVCAYSPKYPGGYVLPLIAINTRNNCYYMNDYTTAFSTQYHYNVLGLYKVDFTLEGHNHLYISYPYSLGFYPSNEDFISLLNGFIIGLDGSVIRWNADFNRQPWRTTIDCIDYP